MSVARCQICGRRAALTVKGLVGRHHFHGEPCEGAGFPPFNVSDARLEAIAEAAADRARALRQEIGALYQARANRIEPELIARAGEAERIAARLARRLARNRAWPARYARQMALHGYADPPPAYLAS